MTEKELIIESLYFQLYDKNKAVDAISTLDGVITHTWSNIASYRIKNGNNEKITEQMNMVEQLKTVRDTFSSYYTDYEALRLEERKLHREVLKLRQENEQLRTELSNTKKAFEDL